MLEGPGYGPLRLFRTFEEASLLLKVDSLRLTGIVTLSIVQLTPAGGTKVPLKNPASISKLGQNDAALIEVETMLNYC